MDNQTIDWTAIIQNVIGTAGGILAGTGQQPYQTPPYFPHPNVPQAPSQTSIPPMMVLMIVGLAVVLLRK